MACIDSEQWMKPYQHNQQHPHMQLMEVQQQMQLLEQMREQVRLLEH
jgi:hypothetical protein